MDTRTQHIRQAAQYILAQEAVLLGVNYTELDDVEDAQEHEIYVSLGGLIEATLEEAGVEAIRLSSEAGDFKGRVEEIAFMKGMCAEALGTTVDAMFESASVWLPGIEDNL